MSNELEHPERPPQPLKALTRGGFLGEPAPDHKLPDGPMDPADARLLIEAELFIDGDPEKNLATFVTTWMGKDVTELIGQNLHRNFIDHAEYPQTAEIEQRCIRMLADLFHAPGETMGARTQGSSEAIMLGALAMKWKWRARQEKAKKDTSKPNLIFGGDVHVVWEKFCRYFDVEPRIVPLQEDKLVIGPEDVEPHIDENTVGVAAVLGTTFTGHADDVVGINELLLQVKEKQGLDIPLHVDGASGAFVWPFLYPDSEWEFRLEQVHSINASGHKFGLVYPGIGWLVFRSRDSLPDDLVFHEDYLGKRDATFTLNFSTGSGDGPGSVLQLHSLRPFGLRVPDQDDAGEHRAARRADQEHWTIRAHRLRRAAAPRGVQAHRRSGPTTSSTSPPSSRPSEAGWCPPTTYRRTRRKRN